MKCLFCTKTCIFNIGRVRLFNDFKEFQAIKAKIVIAPLEYQNSIIAQTAQIRQVNENGINSEGW
jgi:hypothetical protein